MNNLKINIGCGKIIKKDYINIDVIDFPGIDLKCDIRKLPYGKESVDEILANDVLEHFGRLEWRSILAYWYSLLKKGGVISIQTPDIIKLFEMWKTKEIDKTGPPHTAKLHMDDKLIRRIFGEQDFPEDTHKTGITMELIRLEFNKLNIKITHESFINGNLRIQGIKL
jgi:predicted SAM-dependent methyltransferase